MMEKAAPFDAIFHPPSSFSSALLEVGQDLLRLGLVLFDELVALFWHAFEGVFMLGNKPEVLNDVLINRDGVLHVVVVGEHLAVVPVDPGLGVVAHVPGEAGLP